MFNKERRLGEEMLCGRRLLLGLVFPALGLRLTLACDEAECMLPVLLLSLLSLPMKLLNRALADFGERLRDAALESIVITILITRKIKLLKKRATMNEEWGFHLLGYQSHPQGSPQSAGDALQSACESLRSAG